MNEQIRNWGFGFFAFAMSASVAVAGTKCLEGVYSNMADASHSHDIYGNSLLIIGQSKDLEITSPPKPKAQKPTALANAIYSCVSGGDVRSTLARTTINYPDFSFELDRNDICHADNPPVGEEKFITYRGRFSTKGLFISTPLLAGETGKKKMVFMKMTKSYCR